MKMWFKKVWEYLQKRREQHEYADAHDKGYYFGGRVLANKSLEESYEYLQMLEETKFPSRYSSRKPYLSERQRQGFYDGFKLWIERHKNES